MPPPGFSPRALFLPRGLPLRPPPPLGNSRVRRPRHADAQACGLLPLRRALFARLAHAQRLRRRVPDSSRHLPGALELGRLGRHRRNSLRLLPSLVLPPLLLRRSHLHEDPPPPPPLPPPKT